MAMAESEGFSGQRERQAGTWKDPKTFLALPGRAGVRQVSRRALPDLLIGMGRGCGTHAGLGTMSREFWALAPPPPTGRLTTQLTVHTAPPSLTGKLRMSSIKALWV